MRDMHSPDRLLHRSCGSVSPFSAFWKDTGRMHIPISSASMRAYTQKDLGICNQVEKQEGRESIMPMHQPQNEAASLPALQSPNEPFSSSGPPITYVREIELRCRITHVGHRSTSQNRAHAPNQTNSFSETRPPKRSPADTPSGAVRAAAAAEQKRYGDVAQKSGRWVPLREAACEVHAARVPDSGTCSQPGSLKMMQKCFGHSGVEGPVRAG